MSKSKFTVSVLILFAIVFSSLPNIGAVVNPDFIVPRNVYEYGGTLTTYASSDFDTLNPYRSFGSGWTMSRLVYENLIMTGPNFEIRPWLAESWEWSDGGLTLTFHLFENVTWSDGVPLTSEDVKFTFESWETQEMPRMTPYIVNIESIETPDPYTVVFHYIEPDCTVLSEAYAGPATCIVPKHIWENIEDWKTWDNGDPELAIGSGPFMLEEWKKGEYLSFTYNPNYWMGRPYMDNVVIVIIKMRDVALMAFEKGEIAKFSINGNEVSRFLDPEKYRIYMTEDAAVPFFCANNKRRPGNDTAFREALEYVVDREKMTDLAFYGYAASVHHVLPAQHEVGNWIPPEDITHPINLTKANELLDNAGYIDVNDDGWREYPDGDKMELEMTVTDFERYIRMAEVIMEGLKGAGINVKLDVLDSGAYSVKTYKTYVYDFTLGRWGWSYPEPLGKLKWFLSYGTSFTGYANPEFDELYKQAYATVDPDERRPIIWEMCRLLAEDHAFVPTVTNLVLNAVNVEKWGGWSLVNPYGPLSNDKMWPWYNIHLPGAPEALTTTLTVDVTETALQKEPVTISATIKDDKGKPIEGVYINFFVGSLGVGASLTDSDGAAKFTWVPTETGSFEIHAGFEGSTEYGESTSTTRTVSVGSAEPSPTPTPTPTPTPPPEKPDYTGYYIAAIAIVALVAVLFYTMTKKT